MYYYSLQIKMGLKKKYFSENFRQNYVTVLEMQPVTLCLKVADG
jgi:hypothetical protein